MSGVMPLRGRTVGEYIRERRLVCCRRDLADASLAHQSITSIAFRWGFSESSSFSRAFRQAFQTARDDSGRVISGWRTSTLLDLVEGPLDEIARSFRTRGLFKRRTPRASEPPEAVRAPVLRTSPERHPGEMLLALTARWR
jgi:hypothetical protein